MRTRQSIPRTHSLLVEFRKQTEEKLQKKLDSAKENREKVLQAKVEKAKAPIEKGLASVQQNLAKLEEERQSLQEKIQQKLDTAETSTCEYLLFSIHLIFFRSTRTIGSIIGKIS